MFKQSPSSRRASQALFLVAALLFQSFAAPTRSVVYANPGPEKKTAPEMAQPSLPDPRPMPVAQQPNAPQAASIATTLTDNVTAATKIAPGANINYTATITNNGAVVGTDDATNLNFSAPLDTNTTLVGGSIHASPIAFNDTYNWVGNTQLDTAARSLPAVTNNDIAVNAPAGTDTFTVTAIAGGGTALGGTVTLASPSGAFTYTPPLNRPNAGDGAAVNDTFTYTITNNADPSLTSTGTVTITLTGRVFYLQAGAAGDGRSNTPSGNPATMSTNADKASDIFYIFSNAGSLNGLFSVDAGQQLLGQAVALVINIPVLGSTTLFPVQAPTPTTTNGAGNCVTLAGAPGNNTVRGFNIGNCSGVAIAGSNVGTLTVNTLSINSTGQGLDLTGVSTPTVSVVLGGLTSTGGAKNVNLVGLNGTITLANGTLSGATGNAFDVSGGAAAITYLGNITNSGAKQVNIANMTGGSATFDGAINGTGTGINLATNGTATMTFRGGVVLSTAANNAFSATGGGTVNVCDENPCVSGSTGALVNTLTTTTGTALNVVSTTIGANKLEFRSITANGSSNNNGITLDSAGAGGLTVSGNGGTCTSAATCTGGTISNKTGADGNTIGTGIYVNNTSNVSITRMKLNDFSNYAVRGTSVTNFTMNNCFIDGVNGSNAGADEGTLIFDNLFGTATFSSDTIKGGIEDNVRFANTTLPALSVTVDSCTIRDTSTSASGNDNLNIRTNVNANINIHVTNNTFAATNADHIQTIASDQSLLTIVATGNGLSGGGGGSALGQGITISGGNATPSDSTEVVRFNISNNVMSGTIQGGAININEGSGNGNWQGQVVGNTIGTAAVSCSGASQSSGVRLENHSKGVLTGIVSNNIIHQTCGAGGGISLTAGDTTASGLGNGPLNATVVGNTVDTPGGSADHGVVLVGGAGVTNNSNQICLDLLNNSSTGSPVIGPSAFAYRIRQRFGQTVFLPGYGGANNNNAAVQTYFQGRPNTAIAGDGGTYSITNTVGVAPPNGPGGGFVNTPGGAQCTQPTVPTMPQPDDQTASNRLGLNSNPSTLALAKVEAEFVNSPAPQIAPVVASVVGPNYRGTIRNVMHHALGTMAGVANKLDSIITPTAYAQESTPNAPTNGENVTINTIATFPAGGKSITIKYSAVVNTPPLARQVQTQGTVTAAGGISVLTDDPEPAGPANPTVTLVDTLMTWNGSTNTDWNTITNWTQPAGGTQYAPGVANPAINDVVIPNVGAQPNISATDIGLFSLSIANGRTLTITSPRVLTIGGSPGGDLTIDGIISGGSLNLGTGTHVINNAGGTGSVVGGNQATVLSGATVTLNNNLQMSSLTVNAGGNMTIANRTLSLARAGAALNIPGGATFTTTGSTVVLNGGAAQTIAGIAYNNLTINNSIGAHVTGVTLQGNASVAGVLTLTSSDLDTTGAFTLTMPVAATSGPATGATDVVGNVKRTGFVSGGAALSFGNPFNTIRINSGAAPADINMLIAKNPPATYAAAVQRSYTITPNGANGPATLRLHYRQAELNGNVEAPPINFNLRKGPTWANAVVPTSRNTGVPEDNWLENNAVASFSEWTMATLAPTASGGVINGRITRADGTPVEGAVINLSGGQSRKTITDAEGNYHFSNVDANGFYTVTPSRANFSFNPFNRSFSMVGNQTEAAFNGTMLGDNLNPLDTPEYFVRQQYVDILSREPDEDGFNYWSNHILACGGDADCVRAERTGVASAFFIENEFRNSGAFIYNVYKGALGRRPVYAEYSVDRRNVVGGATLEEQKQAFAEAFVTRAEFANRYQSNTTAESFVDALLANVQQTSGVDLSSQRDSLIESYNTGTNQAASRTLVLRGVTESAAVRDANYNSAFVVVEYFGYLHRGPDQQGLEFWLNVLNTGDPGNYRGMVCSFITSREYQNRFSVVVSHSNAECGQ